jgi:hypothetical protein
MVVALVLTFLLIYDLANRTNLDQFLSDPVPVDADPGIVDCSNQALPVAYIGLHGLDAGENTVRGDVTLCFSYRYLRSLRLDDRVGTPLYSQTVVPRLRRRFESDAFTVDVVDNGTNLVLRRQMPLAALTRPRISYEQLGAPFDTYSLPSVVFPADGSPQDFPLDNYLISGSVDVTLPPGVPSNHPTIPSEATIVAVYEPDMHGFNIEMSRTNAAQGSLSAVVTRAPAVVYFTVTLALIPLPLVVVLVFTLSFRPRHTEPAELLLAGGAILIAVLPIRAVLVPPSLSSLTLVDLCLGAEMGILMAVIIWNAVSPSTPTETGKRQRLVERGSAEQ